MCVKKIENIEATQCPLTHTVGVLSLSPTHVFTHSDTHVHPLQIFALKLFTVRQKYLCMFLFTFEDNCFVQRVICSVGHRVVLYIFNLPIVSMECMMSTNSRNGVLLLAGIQLVRLQVAWKVFLETYQNVFHSALQNSLYQYAM